MHLPLEASFNFKKRIRDMPEHNERVQAAAAGLKNRVDGKMSHLWWAFMLRGVLALGLGVGALIWPGLTLGLLIQLIGLYALLDGATGLFGGLRNRNLQPYFLSALVSLLVGAVLLFWPGLTVKTLLIILGIWALLHGVNLLLTGRSTAQDDPNRGLLMTIGSIQAVIGVILIIWPGVGVVTLSWLVAALAFVVGAMLVFLATRMRRVKQHVANFGDVS
jgi:uncharacterized membrane protein HdeD (DUF308 family)